MQLHVRPLASVRRVRMTMIEMAESIKEDRPMRVAKLLTILYPHMPIRKAVRDFAVSEDVHCCPLKRAFTLKHFEHERCVRSSEIVYVSAFGHERKNTSLHCPLDETLVSLLYLLHCQLFDWRFFCPLLKLT